MSRILLFLALLVLTAPSSSLGNMASVVWADTSSMDWDVSMTDAAPTGNDPVCVSDNDGNIETGECPEISSNLWIDTKDATSNEAFLDVKARAPGHVFFDLATQVWKTGTPGADLDGDGLPEPGTGVAQLSNLTHATTVGRTTLSIENNVVLGNIAANNIDDVAGSFDVTVTGQPPVCGANQPGPTGTFSATSDIWSATTSYLNFVPSSAAQPNMYTVGQDCSAGGGTPDPYGIPDGVDCTPAPIPFVQAVIGLPLGNYVARGFGIANLPISPPALYIAADINVLVYNMVSVPEVQGYVEFTTLQVLIGGSPLDQTVTMCPPYFAAPMGAYGITQDSIFPNPPGPMQTPSEIHLQVVGGTGTYGFNIHKSVEEDWDGDTIASHYDRCNWDPNSGAAAQDTDGDFLTGLCETTGAGNGEGNNPLPGGPNTAPPWDPGQDVDGDGYLNSADNCSIIADADVDDADGDGNPATGIDYQLDTDLDGVGDVCEMSPLLGLPAGAELVAGDGSGYPGRLITNIASPGSVFQPQPASAPPGKFVDRDTVCTDPFTPGTAEPLLDPDRVCLGVDAVGRPFNVPSGISALARTVVDSDDDGDPDLLDWPDVAGADPIEWMDTNSDSDNDSHTDACEAFMGSDPLDASSVPAGPPPAGDCDGDTTSDAAEEAAGTSPFSGLDPDADGDGCTRSQEQAGAYGVTPGATAAGGVSFQDQAWYDFYDVPSPTNNDPTPNGTRNGAINVQDVVGVLKYVGTFENGPSNGKVDYDRDKDSDGIKDGIDYDRSPSPAPNPPKDAGPPNGAINLGDVVSVLGQMGRSCL